MWTSNSTLKYIPKSTENRYSNKKLYGDVYSSFIHSNQKVSFYRWINNVVLFIYLSIQCNIIQPLKGMIYSHLLQHGWTLKTFAKWKKPDPKGYKFYDSIYSRCSTDICCINAWMIGCWGLSSREYRIWKLVGTQARVPDVRELLGRRVSARVLMLYLENQ